MDKGLGFKMLGREPKKSFLFNGSHHGRSTLNSPNIADIMMHDININGMKKLESLVLALHFSHDQVNTTPLIEAPP